METQKEQSWRKDSSAEIRACVRSSRATLIGSVISGKRPAGKGEEGREGGELI